MGSAFSSNGKGALSSSMLRIGRTGIALLLFVAGDVAMLHHADSSLLAWIPLQPQDTSCRVHHRCRANEKKLQCNPTPLADVRP
ncbi:unnamed protein product [Urochloa humidicola]